MYHCITPFTILLLSCIFVHCLDESFTDTFGFGILQEDYRFEMERISWQPRAYYLKGFLTEEECQHLIKEASPSMAVSTVVDNETGRSKLNNARTSTGTFLEKTDDEIVNGIEERIARITMLPVEHQEAMQILRYENGQKYEPHFDYFHDKVNQNPANGGQRVVTILMYLTNVEEGGETIFPNAKSKSAGSDWSDCALDQLAVHPNKGDALMFYSLHPNGEPDDTSLHGSCPTLKGVKWSATKWIHVLPLGTGYDQDIEKPPKHCQDIYRACPTVAKRGQCLEDKLTREKYCRRSCNSCDT